MEILLIDNYDSFVHNLGRYFVLLGQSIHVWRNDDRRLEEIQADSFDAIVLSPGPGAPIDAGLSLEVVRRCGSDVPMLGVCLGHQVICEAYGGQIVRAKRPLHGKGSAVDYTVDTPLFRGIASGTVFGRYHSLVVDPASLPPSLHITATSPDGEVMAVQHQKHPVFGVQFHPESILSPRGMDLLANFLDLVQSFRSDRDRLLPPHSVFPVR
ncbi:MAG: aminodeoxychorismate/anthranilate synthase component II [Pirellulaceae bacterium]|nr:MAG: aminodeoxychorismate/anthranilate synthase component II [Pirellulaceae bacterium]